jgi:hypothetical protein
MESSVLLAWLSDGRNLVITLLVATVLTLSLLIAIATVSSVTAPSPYERHDMAEAARVELRDRMNSELANQAIINRDLYSQIGQIKEQFAQNSKSYHGSKKSR